MKVKYIGFGGGFTEYLCYEDKPVWITKSDIEDYKAKMLEKRKE